MISSSVASWIVPKKFRTKRLVAIISSTFLLFGCAPTAREVADEMSKIPVGISRSEFREELTQAYLLYLDTLSAVGGSLEAGGLERKAE